MQYHWRKPQVDAGFSLVEIMIGAGLLAVLALGFSTMLGQTNKASRGIAVTNDFTNLSTLLGQVLAQPKSCTQFMTQRVVNLKRADAIAGTFPALTEISYVDGGTTHTFAKVGELNQGLRVTKIELRGPVVDMTQFGGADEPFLVHLYVEAERLGAAKVGGGYENLPGSPVISKDFAITVVSDSVGVIKNCFQNPGVDAACSALGGDIVSSGTVCDLSPEICRRTGGVAGGAVGARTCAYADGGTPPIDTSQVICRGLGGTYVPAAIPPASRCQFPLAPTTDPDGPASLRSTCAALNGVIVNVGVTPHCNLCDNNGGVFDAATGKCDFRRPFCEANGGIFDPVTGKCDMAALFGQTICNGQGGTWIAGPPTYCAPKLGKRNCYTATIGRGLPWSGGDWGPSFYNLNCPAGFYVADAWGVGMRNSADDLFQVTVQCCQP